MVYEGVLRSGFKYYNILFIIAKKEEIVVFIHIEHIGPDGL